MFDLDNPEQAAADLIATLPGEFIDMDLFQITEWTQATKTLIATQQGMLADMTNEWIATGHPSQETLRRYLRITRALDALMGYAGEERPEPSVIEGPDGELLLRMEGGEAA